MRYNDPFKSKNVIFLKKHYIFSQKISKFTRYKKLFFLSVGLNVVLLIMLLLKR